MKNFIIKSNEWYDNLSEVPRFLFFLLVAVGGLALTEYFMYVHKFIWAFPIWAGTLLFWRMSYVIMKKK